MEAQAIRVACPHEGFCGDQSRCQEPSTCAVLVEAPSLTALGMLVAQWLADHPRFAPLSLSHAAETRHEPIASLAGPRAVLVYTGVLLVRASHREPSAVTPVPDRAWRDVPPGERDELAHLLSAQRSPREDR